VINRAHGAFKVRGQLKVTITGEDMASDVVSVVDDCYTIWEKGTDAESLLSENSIPKPVPFSVIIPSSFKDSDGKQCPLPPSHVFKWRRDIAKLLPQTKCEYSLEALVTLPGRFAGTSIKKCVLDT
jgi:hypothetical protein